MTLGRAYMTVAELMSSSHAPSRWHIGQHCKDHVSDLIMDSVVTLLQVPTEVFILSQSI